MSLEGRFPIFSEIELAHLPRGRGGTRVGPGVGYFPKKLIFPFSRIFQIAQKLLADNLLDKNGFQVCPDFRLEIDHKKFFFHSNIFFFHGRNPKNHPPSHHQKTSPLPNLPQTFCSLQEIRESLQRGQEDLPSRFLFPTPQTFPLHHAQPILRYLRNFFSHQKFGHKLPSENFSQPKATVVFL